MEMVLGVCLKEEHETPGPVINSECSTSPMECPSECQRTPLLSQVYAERGRDWPWGWQMSWLPACSSVTPLWWWAWGKVHSQAGIQEVWLKWMCHVSHKSAHQFRAHSSIWPGSLWQVLGGMIFRLKTPVRGSNLMYVLSKPNINDNHPIKTHRYLLPLE